ncbi:MAG TPA: glycosyltransferase, partial [Thermoanaerobaculia bacterium]|nr:glycosyltransferase [Thermoanaerobaculia bacterium]
PSLAAAIRWAAGAVGARVLHVENLASLPPLTLAAARREGLAVVLSLHDFAAFCPRPHLLERPHERFCRYSRDPERCRRCLSQDWRPVGLDDQGERRRAEHELLRAADRLVFPSAFLRRTIGELYDGLDPARQTVIPPALDLPVPIRRRPRGGVRRIAFVGGSRPHKGGRLLAEIVRHRRLLAGDAEEWVVYGGGGDGETLRRLRSLGVRVRGYYRAGTLPSLLAADGADVAILPSIVPESYGLVLDECWLAGCPVVAFDLGAVGERLRQGGGGIAVPVAGGARGLAEAVARVPGDEGLPVPAVRPSSTDAAEAYRLLFAGLGAAA